MWSIMQLLIRQLSSSIKLKCIEILVLRSAHRKFHSTSGNTQMCMSHLTEVVNLMCDAHYRVSVTYQLILVRSNCCENRLWEDKCLEFFRLQVCDRRISWWFVTLHKVNPRLVLVHRVEDELQQNRTVQNAVQGLGLNWLHYRKTFRNYATLWNTSDLNTLSSQV
jgi:hypothetical protein